MLEVLAFCNRERSEPPSITITVLTSLTFLVKKSRMKKSGMSIFWQYSGTLPYDHPVYKTTSLLRPYSFKPNVKTIESFYYFDDPVNATTSLLRPGFYGPTVVALTGFHCTRKKLKSNPVLVVVLVLESEVSKDKLKMRTIDGQVNNYTTRWLIRYSSGPEEGLFC